MRAWLARFLSRSAGWQLVVLYLTASCGYAASFLALGRLHARAGSDWRWLVGACLVFLAPYVYRQAVGRWRQRTARRVAAEIAYFTFLAVLMLSQFAAGFLGAALLGLVVAQGFALDRWSHQALRRLTERGLRPHAPVGRAAIGVAVVQATAAVEWTPGLEVLLLLGATVTAGLVGVVLLHGEPPARTKREHRPRFLAGASFALLVLGAAVASYPWLIDAPAGVLGGHFSAESRRARGTRGPLPDGLPSGTEQRTPEDYPTELEFRGQLAPLSDEVVLHLAADEPRGPIYLRGGVLDELGRDGLTLSRTSPPPAATESSGWTVLEEPRDEPRIYHVFQRRLRVPGQGWALLFAPRPVVAVRAEGVRFDPDGLLVTAADVPEWFGYEVLADTREPRGSLRDLRMRHPDPMYTALPAGPAVDALAQLARTETAEAASEHERVELLLRHFHDRYRYSLSETELPGLEGLLEFTQRREGYCTHFAATCVVMLRSLGIPARVATGYLAYEPVPERGRLLRGAASNEYVARARNAHAWVEVFYEGLGWRTIEPTASDQREAALARGPASRNAGLADWMRDLGEDLTDWREGGVTQLGDVLSRLAAAPVAAFESLRASPLSLALVIASLLAFLWARSRRLRGIVRGAVSGGGVTEAARGSLRELLAAELEAAGALRRPSSTLQELAAEAEHRRPELAGVREVARRLDADRFGGRALEPGEVREVRGELRRYRRALESAAGA